MNLISSQNHNAQEVIISLDSVIPEFISLKLLIMHTPFPLEISSLSFCHNLLKLDLSRNRIKSFPYLGHLRLLKILFIHENNLEIQSLVRIFQEERQQYMSQLAKNILWITYWGNSNGFLGRHYIVNNTMAIACDMNMISQQEKNSFPSQQDSQTFSKETDISHLFKRQRSEAIQVSQEAYMKDLWSQINILRKMQQKLCPVVKIQKHYRGYIVRKKQKSKRQQLLQRKNLQYKFFNNWKVFTKKQHKLLKLLKMNHKQYLLQNIKDVLFGHIKYKLRCLSQIAKRRVRQRKIRLKYELKFYSTLRNNYLLLQDVYHCVQLKQSSEIYIYKQALESFNMFIKAFVLKFTKANIQVNDNNKYKIKYLHTPNNKPNAQIIKIIENQQKCIVYVSKPDYQIKSSNYMLNKMNLSRHNKQKLERNQQRRKIIVEQEKQGLIKIKADQQTLRHIVRGIFLYNNNQIGRQQINKQRINFISQYWLNKIGIIVKIQGLWRGSVYRKNNAQNYKIMLKFQRSTIKIQKWIRKLSNFMLKCFLYKSSRALKQIHQNQFYIQYKNYQKILQINNKYIKNAFFLQQNCSLYLDELQKQLVLSWNNDSKYKRIHEMIQANIPLFYSRAIVDILGVSKQQSIMKTTLTKKLKKCDLNHLFHYNTKTFLFQKHGNKYLKIVCKSKADSRFRALAILLLTFDFKNKQKIILQQNYGLQKYQTQNQLMNNQIFFICTKNSTIMKNHEMNIKHLKHKIYMTNNKIYLKLHGNNKKPIKIQDNFIIFFVQNNREQAGQHRRDTQPPTQQKQKQTQYNRRSLIFLDHQSQYNSVSIYQLFKNKNLRIQSQHIQENASISEIRQADHKIIVRKRSLKQFKLQRRVPIKINPQFMFDNTKSIQNDASQQSIIVTPKKWKNQYTEFVAKSQVVQAPLQINLSQKISSFSRKKYLIDMKERKNEEKFIKKFTNMNNFIQNQLLIQQKRRIKTQEQKQSHKIADKIRFQHKRQTLSKQLKLKQKLQKIKQNDHHHKSLIENYLTQKQQTLKKRFASNERLLKDEKLNQLYQKHRNQKRSKITFIQQQFPIIIKNPVKLKINYI